MSNKVIKELQKLLALCMEINEKTEHDIRFEVDKTSEKPMFNIVSFGKDLMVIKYIAYIEPITLPNINKCRQKLLKYKEW